jgi:hypothetical protein
MAVCFSKVVDSCFRCCGGGRLSARSRMAGGPRRAGPRFEPNERAARTLCQSPLKLTHEEWVSFGKSLLRRAAPSLACSLARQPPGARYQPPRTPVESSSTAAGIIVTYCDPRSLPAHARGDGRASTGNYAAIRISTRARRAASRASRRAQSDRYQAIRGAT